MTGIVRHWDHHRHFGKLTGAADRRSYFVHGDDLIDVRDLAPDQRVEFTPTVTPRGLRAIAVRLIETRSAPPRIWPYYDPDPELD